MDTDKTLVIPICFRIVFNEVQVHAVGEGQSICISIGPIYVQICTSLTIVNLGPVTWDTCDVIRFEYFLDAIDGVAAVDDGPGTGGDVEKFFDVNSWFHYNLQVF